MKAYYRNFNQDFYKDKLSKEKITGGYGIPDYNVIYIDENLSLGKQPLTIIHEVLNLYLRKRVRHSLLDQMAIDIIDSLLQLDFEIKKIT